MKTLLRSTLGFLSALVLSVSVHAAELGAGAVSVGVAKGDVTYRVAGSEVDLPAPAGTLLPQGATLKTGADSSATVVFSSGSEAFVGAEAVVEVSKFVQAPFTGTLVEGEEPSVSETVLNATQGEVISKVAKLRKGSQYTVNSPVGAAGVRGTIFAVATVKGKDGEPDVIRVEVTQGNVFLSFADGSGVTIPAGWGWNSQTRTLYQLSIPRINQINSIVKAGAPVYTGAVPTSTIPITDLIGVSVN